MIRLITLYPWPDDPKRFKDYFVAHHIPLCRAIPGIGESHYAFEPETIEGTGRWFCIFETSFSDEIDFKNALESPEGRRASDDVVNYSRIEPTSLIFTSTTA